MKYAVTGATGKFGELAILNLIASVPFNEIVVLARNTDKAQKMYPNLTIKKCDYTNPQTLKTAFDDIDRLLFVSSQPDPNYPRIKQHQNVVTAAAKAGVKFIAYTSFPHANTSKAPLAIDHYKTEEMISDARIPHSFLRNNWYLENETNLIKNSVAGKDFLYTTDTETVGWALEKYYAKGAAKILADYENTPNEIYEFHGVQHTYPELAKAIREVSDNKFSTRKVSITEYRDYLTKMGMPQPTIDFKIKVQKLIQNGNLSERHSDNDVKFGMSHEEILKANTDNENDLENVLGQPLPSLTKQVKELLTKKPKYLL